MKKLNSFFSLPFCSLAPSFFSGRSRNTFFGKNVPNGKRLFACGLKDFFHHFFSFIQRKVPRKNIHCKPYLLFHFLNIFTGVPSSANPVLESRYRERSFSVALCFSPRYCQK